MRSYHFLFLNLNILSEHYNPLMLLEKFNQLLTCTALSFQSPFTAVTAIQSPLPQALSLLWTLMLLDKYLYPTSLCIYIFSIVSSFIPFELRPLHSILNMSTIPTQGPSHASLSLIKINLQKTGTICAWKCWLILTLVISYSTEPHS